jgi:hypothetical protein
MKGDAPGYAAHEACAERRGRREPVRDTGITQVVLRFGAAHLAMKDAPNCERLLVPYECPDCDSTRSIP